MSSCEKCWRDAGGNPDIYGVLIKERAGTYAPKCTEEEQAGPDAGECPRCKRKTKHQYTGELMCGCEVDRR